ncbi:unnamed protein product, partial [Polarella glacialis]
GTFIATFASAEAAVAAHPSLADISDLQCDLVPEEPEEQPEAAQEQPEEEGALIIKLYIDQLQTCSGNSYPQALELYLRDIPVADYAPGELQEWVDGFGPNTFTLLEGCSTSDGTGSAYVRFESHLEAQSLFDAC